MDIYISSTEQVVVQDNSKPRKMSLRTRGGELEWDLVYTIKLSSEHVKRDLVDCLKMTFQLIPRHGADLMRMSSYSVDLTAEKGKPTSQDKCAAGKDYTLVCVPKSGLEFSAGSVATICVKILLQMGQLTRVSNHSRLYNSSEQSDVMLKCGDMMIPAHKIVLNYHSETFRTAFSSSSFTEGQEGIYEISSEHMSPDILHHVIRGAAIALGGPGIELFFYQLLNI
jgi:hypothetical protein